MSDDLTRLSLRFAPEKVKPNTGVIAGIASTDRVDGHGTVFARGAFAASLKRHAEAGTRPLMLWQHYTHEPIGVWESVHETARGLEVRGALNLETTRGREAAALLRQGALSGLSIGVLANREASTIRNGVETIRECDLVEISIVSRPSNPDARVTSVRSIDSRAALERALRDVGLPRAAASKVAAGGWPALGGASPKDHERAALASHIRRVAALFR